jgi:hypothetical protein
VLSCLGEEVCFIDEETEEDGFIDEETGGDRFEVEIV